MQETEFEVTTPAKIKQCKVLGPSDSKWQEAEISATRLNLPVLSPAPCKGIETSYLPH